MSDFTLYFTLGFEHIANFEAYDHLLFVVALCSVFQWQNKKNIFLLITGFTIGHSLTLALSVLDIVKINAIVIEILIPITILITACQNLYLAAKDKLFFHSHLVRYGEIIFFGLIHGLGFSNYLKMILSEEQSIIFALFSFNVGLEIGQIFIILIASSVFWLLLEKFSIPSKILKIIINTCIVLISLYLIFNLL